LQFVAERVLECTPLSADIVASLLVPLLDERKTRSGHWLTPTEEAYARHQAKCKRKVACIAAQGGEYQIQEPEAKRPRTESSDDDDADARVAAMIPRFYSLDPRP
jgi:hypothetical protein